MALTSVGLPVSRLFVPWTIRTPGHPTASVPQVDCSYLTLTPVQRTNNTNNPTPACLDVSRCCLVEKRIID